MSTNRHSGRLTSTDASFLYLERKEAPMHIGAVCMLDGEIDYEAYVESIERKLGRLPRFREKVVSTPLFLGHPTWETDREFDVRNHVKLHHLEAPGNDDQLKELVGTIIEQLLDRSRPLWELHVIHGLEGGDSAVVSKVHHAMVDGVGGNEILTTILDLSPKPDERTIESDYQPTEPADTRERIVEALWENARSTVDALSEYQRGVLDATRSINRERVRDTLELMRETLPDLALPPKRLPFNKHCGGRRRLTWTTFSFAEARAVRAALGGTVNDVVLACLADAVSRYCKVNGVDVRGRTMRVFVPVNVRPEVESAALGNLVSVLPVEVPLDVDDPTHRIGLIRETTRVLKRGRVADGISLMSNLLGVVPVPFQAAFGALAVSPFPIFNLVCTNVPGPQIPLYGLGKLLKAYYPYVPVGFDMGVGCAIFSYNQTLHIGLNADLDACPDVERLREAFDDAIAALKEAAGVGTIAPIETGRRRPAPVAAEPAPEEAATAKKKSAGKKAARKAGKKAAKKAAKKKTAAKKTKKSAKVEAKSAKKSRAADAPSPDAEDSAAAT